MMHDSDEDIQVSPPPAKRQRKSQRRIPKPSSEQLPFWFYDGDIMIGVEGQSWKIHRSKLMCSVVFADMLELPQPSDIESMHGWWLYERDKFDSQTIVFDTIAGALRISNKYDIADLRQWSTFQLLLRWPQDLTKMTYTAFPHAAEAICLARECDAPEILPAAFYALSIVRWSRRAEGGSSHLQLSPADLRCFIVGREELQDHLHSILSGVDERTGGHTVLCDDCENATLTWLSSRLQADASSPYGTWLLRDLQDIAVNGYPRLVFVHYLCEMAFRLRIKEFIRHLQEVIPRYFMLRT
ncbi:hypothetical protein AZE42_10511 [Rhizopogon vesiculosus]|uniref:BTB domain-containing protein n=1 Tax=Rhizopogon vesiculosus TaxID=180088 RepID=A0A1J8QFV5_9AGAM|nr:hypothetical protein AZE42_10511 [Rhizopogon vesiculosus]